MTVLVASLAGESVLTPPVSVARFTRLVGTRSGKLDVAKVVASAIAAVTAEVELFVQVVSYAEFEMTTTQPAVVDSPAKVATLVGTRAGETFWVVKVLSVARSTVLVGTRSGNAEVVSRLARVMGWAGMRRGETVRTPAVSSVARSTALVGTRFGKGEMSGSATGLA